MVPLTIEVPEFVGRRLEALAHATSRSPDELAREGVESFVGSRASRRAILKARKAVAKASGRPYSIADLGWLEGYAGQSLDVLLLFEGSETAAAILFAIEEAVQQKAQEHGPGRLTGTEVIILSVMALEREVGNGGFDQFFRNTSRRFAPMIVNHLLIIDCDAIAEIAQQAINSLGVTELTVPAIETTMAAPNVDRDRALNRCDLKFYEQSGLFEKLLAYVRAHANAVGV